jgi:hypothetical protein
LSACYAQHPDPSGRSPEVSEAGVAATTPDVGDRVVLSGTRIVGDVKDLMRGDDRVVLKVTAVLGTAPGTKRARAWHLAAH